MNKITIVGIALLIMLAGFGVKAQTVNSGSTPEVSIATLLNCSSITVHYIENGNYFTGDTDTLDHLSKEHAAEIALKVLNDKTVRAELSKSNSGSCVIEAHYSLNSQSIESVNDALSNKHRSAVEVNV